VSSVPKAKIILRVIKTILFLEAPHTIKELSQHLEISKFVARIYFAMLKEAGLALKSRERPSPKTGKNPMEYSIDCQGMIVLEVVKMIAKLRGL